jgi:RNA polymerase subunit RPABC4/transcription elongation factor Spt4
MLMSTTGVRPSALFKKVAPELDINAYPAKEVAEFVNKITHKVTDFVDEDGEFKITEATKDCDQPNYQQSEDIYYLTAEKGNWQAKAANPKSGKEAIAKIEEIENEIQELCWEASGLKKDSMTEWEQMLVVLQVQRSAIDNTKTALGQQVKN